MITMEKPRFLFLVLLVLCVSPCLSQVTVSKVKNKSESCNREECVDALRTGYVHAIPKANETEEVNLPLSPEIKSIANDRATLSQFPTLTKMFDHWEWDREAIQELVSTPCAKDMGIYLDSLRAGEIWALKVADSSGRYRGQLMFGNMFWMGSINFCVDINYHNEQARKNPKANLNIVPSMSYTSTVLTIDLRPLINESTIFQVGQCLPETCSPSDVETILRIDSSLQKFNQQREEVERETGGGGSIAVVNARKVPGPYSLLEDERFQYLACTIALILVAVVIGTYLELKELLKAKRIRKAKEAAEAAVKNGNEASNGNASTNGEVQAVSPPLEKNIFVKIFLCFSLLKNGNDTLCLKPPSRNSISALNGIRIVCFMWSIMVHTCNEFWHTSENQHFRVLAERDFLYQIITNSSFSVDTFFFLSGLLVAMNWLRKGGEGDKLTTELSNDKSLVGQATKKIVYRYLRLTPVYLIIIFVNELGLKFTYNRAVFKPKLVDHVTCHNHWWRNALYINNWFPFEQICMYWSWSLPNDMMFYIMAVFLLIVATTKSIRTSVKYGVGILVACILISAGLSLKDNYTYKVANPMEAWDLLYIKPWMRVGPYLMGMLCGYILAKFPTAPKMSTKLKASLWVGSSALMLLVVFGVWNGSLSKPMSALYVGVAHACWGLGLVWMISCCHWGLIQPINKFLSYPGFLPLSRISYCAYLVHPIILIIGAYGMYSPYHLQPEFLFICWLGNVAMSFLVAFVAYLLFEAPVLRLLKLIF